MNELTQTVYIVDDDEAVRDSLELLLDTVGLSTHTYPSALAMLEDYELIHTRAQNACFILDIRMPGMSGTELQQVLIDRGSDLPIIFITGHGDIPMAVKAIQRGAMDFIAKPFHDQDLLDRIQQALRLHSERRDQVLEQQRTRDQIKTLTPREEQVLKCILDGKANKIIAAELCLSQRTVEVHRAHVMEKMSAPSLAHLIQKISKLPPS